MTTPNHKPKTLEEFQVEVDRHGVEICGQTQEERGSTSWEDNTKEEPVPCFLVVTKTDKWVEEIRYFPFGFWHFVVFEKKSVSYHGFGDTLEKACAG